MIKPGYVYRAVVSASMYDGDTWTVDIDLGFYTWIKDQRVRLYGIDTPEMRGEEREEGIRVRDWCRKEYPVGTEIIIRTHRDRKGKYGRWLAEIYHESHPNYSVNWRLIMRAMATEVEY